VLLLGVAEARRVVLNEVELSSPVFSKDILRAILIIIILVEIPQSRLDLFVVGLDGFERFCYLVEAHFDVGLWRAIEVLLLAISLNFLTPIANLDQA
jgi:hypothetical protein